MAPSSKAFLPNGQRFDVIPVFGGVSFRSTDLNPQPGAIPPGWTIVINTQKPTGNETEVHRPKSSLLPEESAAASATELRTGTQEKLRQQHYGHHHTQSWSASRSEAKDKEAPTTYRFTKPTLQNDYLYISSITQPSNDAFKPASSPTRQIAMLLWATLWWYFHEPEPNPHLLLSAAAEHGVPEGGRPKGDWRINIKREGVFKGRNHRKSVV